MCMAACLQCPEYHSRSKKKKKKNQCLKMFGLRALIVRSGSTSATGDYFWHKPGGEKNPNPILPTDYRKQHVVQEQGDEHNQQD